MYEFGHEDIDCYDTVSCPGDCDECDLGEEMKAVGAKGNGESIEDDTFLQVYPEEKEGEDDENNS